MLGFYGIRAFYIFKIMKILIQTGHHSKKIKIRCRRELASIWRNLSKFNRIRWKFDLMVEALWWNSYALVKAMFRYRRNSPGGWWNMSGADKSCIFLTTLVPEFKLVLLFHRNSTHFGARIFWSYFWKVKTRWTNHFAMKGSMQSSNI